MVQSMLGLSFYMKISIFKNRNHHVYSNEHNVNVKEKCKMLLANNKVILSSSRNILIVKRSDKPKSMIRNILPWIGFRNILKL